MWRRGKDLPLRTVYCHVVVINGVVYVGGGGSNVVLQYHPGSGEWSKLPVPPVGDFAMASLDGQLVLVGGGRKGGNSLRVWDSTRGGWARSYPAMPSPRLGSAAVGYQHYLIVACGSSSGGVDTVAILHVDGSIRRWYNAQPVPMGGYYMSSVVIGDYWYLSSYEWNDKMSHIFTVHLPTLVSSAVSAARTNSVSIWQELPTPPVRDPTLLAVQNCLLLVGGSRLKHEVGESGLKHDLHRYDPLAEKYSRYGQLPVGMCGPSCAVLPSGELMVAGGHVEGIGYSQQVWISNIEY